MTSEPLHHNVKPSGSKWTDRFKGVKVAVEREWTVRFWKFPFTFADRPIEHIVHLKPSRPIYSICDRPLLAIQTVHFKFLDRSVQSVTFHSFILGLSTLSFLTAQFNFHGPSIFYNRSLWT